ncbi:MAG: hypothetical protein ACKVX7_01620 [Planctomycetota bacterium]
MTRCALLSIAALLLFATTGWSQGSLSSTGAGASAIWAWGDATGIGTYAADTTPDHLYEQSWWFRLASAGSETRFSLAGGTFAGDTATYTYSFPTFNAQLVALLADGTTPGAATAAHTLTITNTSAVPLTITITTYFDFDTNDSAENDSAELVGGDTIVVEDGSYAAAIQGVDADQYQVAAWPALLDSLSNGTVTTLTGGGLPFSPGDFTGAWQWTRTIAAGANEVFAANFELALGACGASVANLACDVDCAAGDVTLSWDNVDTYASIAIERDGALIATLAGDATSFTDAPGLGPHDYSVTASCVALTAPAASCSVTLSGAPAANIIWAAETAAQIDSVAALESALAALGDSTDTATNLLGVSCLSPTSRLWCLLGTFPSNHVLSAAEGDALVAHIVAGGHVYLEGGDVWGFDAPTAFAQYDGIADSGASDGDDSFVAMQGIDFTTALFSGLDATYNQDQAGDDWTDRIEATTTDLGGTSAALVWMSTTLPPYGVGVYHDSDGGFGKTLCQSWEFGGYDGNPVALAAAYLDALGGAGGFRRADTNASGAFDLADCLHLLASLFLPGSPAQDCLDAADMNDDGALNITDALYGLHVLFVPASAPALPPYPACGFDPSADSLNCASYPPCP